MWPLDTELRVLHRYTGKARGVQVPYTSHRSKMLVEDIEREDKGSEEEQEEEEEEQENEKTNLVYCVCLPITPRFLFRRGQNLAQ